MANMRKNFRTYTIALSANQEYPLDVDGDMYAVIDSTGEFTITLDESNRLQKQVEGMGGKFALPYQRVSMLSATAQTVVVVFGFGEFSDARASVNATVNTTISPSDTMDNASDITVGNSATLLKAADSDTKEVLIHVPGDALNSVRVGTNGVTATSGIEVEPGATLAIACEAALYAIRDGSNDVSVSTIKLTRP